jgi:hypothetical protein
MTRVLVLLALACVGPLSAQNTSCPFETCALRIEAGGFFSSARIVRGAQAERVAKADRSDVLRDLMASNDSARAHYARFAHLDRTSDWLRGIGSVLWLGGITLTSVKRSNEALNFAITFTGLSLGTAGGVVGRRAFNQLSQSIWWYNAGLAGVRR